MTSRFLSDDRCCVRGVNFSPPRGVFGTAESGLVHRAGKAENVAPFQR